MGRKWSSDSPLDDWGTLGIIRYDRPHSWRWLVWLAAGAMMAGLYVAPGVIGQ